MSDTSSGNDWELVSGALSSHSLSASSSADAAAAGGDSGGDDGGARDSTPDETLGEAPGGGGAAVLSNVRSGYFATPTSPSKPPEVLPDEELPVAKPTPAEDGATFAAVEDMPASKQVEEIDYSRGILMSESCHELSKLDWMEPRSPGHELLEYEGSGLGSSASNSDSHAPETKDGLEPNSQQVGPLLGSCVSAPFSPSIVSRDNSFRLNLTDEMVADITSQREAGMDKMGVPLEGSAESAALGQDRDSEIWWNKQAALRGVHGRQANTYWSIALAAAVMGLVILGHRWQYERRQNHQLRLRLHLKEEKVSQLVLQLARMKEMLSGRRRVPVLRSSSYFNGSFERY